MISLSITEENSKKNKISKIVNELLLVTSAHGLPRLLKTEKKLVKTVYLICLLASTCLAAYYLQKILFDYITYDIRTAVDLKTGRDYFSYYKFLYFK